MFGVNPFYGQENLQSISFSAGHIDAPYAHLMTMGISGNIPRIEFGDGFATGVTTLGNQTLGTGHWFQNGQTANTVTINVSRLNYIKEWQYVVAGGNDGIIGGVDLSKCTRLWDEVTIIGHQNLTGITFPPAMETDEEFILLRVYGNNLTGRLDFSGVTNLGRTAPNVTALQFYANPNLTAVTFPPIITGQCNPVGRTCDFREIDFSAFVACQGFQFQDNPNLTAITFAESAQTIDIFGNVNLSSCDFKELDFTNLAERFGGIVDISYNSNLTAVTFPQTDLTNKINLRNCGFQSDYTVDLSPLRNLGTSIIIRNNNYGNIIFPSNDNQITEFLCHNMNDLRHFDISPLSGFNVSINPLVCANLTGITFPSGNVFEVPGVQTYQNDLRNLDMTNLTGLSNTIQFYQNFNLSSVTFPETSYSINSVRGFQTNIGILDFSPLKNYGGLIEFYSNNSLSSITFGSTSGTTTEINFYSCDNIQTIDFTPLGNSLSGNIRVHNNPVLRNVFFPITTGTVTEFRAEECTLPFVNFRPLSAGTQDGIVITLDDNSTTFTECNQILDSLSGMGAQNGILYLSGTSGAATVAKGYDTSSGGINGFAIYEDLINNSGWTIFMSGLTV